MKKLYFHSLGSSSDFLLDALAVLCLLLPGLGRCALALVGRRPLLRRQALADRLGQVAALALFAGVAPVLLRPLGQRVALLFLALVAPAGALVAPRSNLSLARRPLSGVAALAAGFDRGDDALPLGGVGFLGARHWAQLFSRAGRDALVDWLVICCWSFFPVTIGSDNKN